MGSRYVGLGYQTKRTFLGKLAVNSLLAGAAVMFSFSALADDVVPKRETRTDVLLPGRGVPGVVVANGQKIFSEGKGDVPACMTCHGAGGWGLEAMGAPRLAGIGFPYLVKELSDLAGGKRTPGGAGAVMPGFAAGLSPQDRRDVAAYVNTLEGPPDLSDLKALKDSGTAVGERYLGEAISKYGVLGKVSACQSCHGYNGRGAAPMFPVIGQQKYTYLVTQLNAWRDGSRANDPYGMMRTTAHNLTDADIANVATYLATAPTTTFGNSITPVTNQ
jgi:cytochrome c553